MSTELQLLNLFEVAKLIQEIRTYTPSIYRTQVPDTERMVLARSMYMYSRNNNCMEWFTTLRNIINDHWKTIDYVLDIAVVPEYHAEVKAALNLVCNGETAGSS